MKEHIGEFVWGPDSLESEAEPIDLETVWEDGPLFLPQWPLVYRPGEISLSVRAALQCGHPVIVAREPGPILFPEPFGPGKYPDTYEQDYNALRVLFGIN